jgi:hypothetical protein
MPITLGNSSNSFRSVTTAGSVESKAAATLLREHVISIVKFPVGPNQVFYDLVDSLPGLATGGRNLAMPHPL